VLRGSPNGEIKDKIALMTMLEELSGSDRISWRSVVRKDRRVYTKIEREVRVAKKEMEYESRYRDSLGRFGLTAGELDAYGQTKALFRDDSFWQVAQAIEESQVFLFFVRFSAALEQGKNVRREYIVEGGARLQGFEAIHAASREILKLEGRSWKGGWEFEKKKPLELSSDDYAAFFSKVMPLIGDESGPEISLDSVSWKIGHLLGSGKSISAVADLFQEAHEQSANDLWRYLSRFN
jgi:hypothetical protein